MFYALHVMVLKKMEDRVNRRDGFWNRGEIGAIEKENWQDPLKDVQKRGFKVWRFDMCGVDHRSNWIDEGSS